MSGLGRLEYKKINQMIYMVCMGVPAVLLINGIFHNSWSEAAAAFSVFLWLLLIRLSGQSSIGYWIWGGIAVLTGGVAYYLYRNEKDMESFLAVLALELFCILAAAAAWLCVRSLWIKIPLLAAEAAGFIYCGICKVEMPKWGVCMGLFCILMLLAEVAERQTKRKSGMDPLVLAPVFVCLLAFFMFLPAKDTPAEWKAVKKVISSVEKTAKGVIAEVGYILSGHGNTYTMSFAGYDQDGGLSGGLYSNNQPQISVTVGKMKAPLYVSGSIYDTYTGGGWEIKEDIGIRFSDQYDTLRQALEDSIYSDKEIWELTRYRGCQIKFEGLRTESLFLPAATEKISLPGQKRTYDMAGGNLRLAKAEGVGFAYQIYFLEVDYGNEKIENLLRQNAWKEPKTLSKEEQKNREELYEVYTRLPEGIPERVYALADEITEGAQTDYDKLRAIEAYLRQFTYSTEIQETPQGRDAVDYFLFDSRTGYCTWFASAMAVLGRCEGIPVRYAEGFLTDKVTGVDNEPVMLGGSAAHAWPEAYIENVGWIPFEPTPGYAGPGGAAWEASKPSKEIGAPDYDSMALNTEQSGMMDADGSGAADGGQKFAAVWENIKKAAALLLKILLFAGGLAGILAVLVLIKHWFLKRKYLAGTNTEKLKNLLTRVLLIGSMYDLKLGGGETLAAYGERADGRLDTPAGTFGDFCRCYEKARFGQREPDLSMVEAAEKYTGALEVKYLAESRLFKKLRYRLK